MHVSGVLARANAAAGQDIKYGLGKGGMNPGSPTPASDGQCDCSGFVSWCLGLSRQVSEQFYKLFNGGWIETTAVWTDISSPVGMFEIGTERPGAVIVYPDADGRQGHIGIIVEPGRVVHCSQGNDRRGNAVQITSLDVFRANPHTRLGWLHGLIEQGGREVLAPRELLAAATPPNYRSLVAGGFFSSDPSDVRVKRSIRTNNPGALNISSWQRSFPGFVGTTQPDSAGNVTSIYVTPEHGVGAWYHLLSARYGYGRDGTLVVRDLARRYAGTAPDSPAVRGYISGWRRWSGNRLDGDSQVSLADDDQVLLLAKGMFGHEIGGRTPLSAKQIAEGVIRERAGTLPED